MWLECRYLDTEVDGSNPGISMSYELFGGIALNNHAFLCIFCSNSISSLIIVILATHAFYFQCLNFFYFLNYNYLYTMNK